MWKCGYLAAILPGVSAHQGTGMVSAAGCSWVVLSLPMTSGSSFLISTGKKIENGSWQFQSERQNTTLAFGNLSHLADMERLITISRNTQ